MKSKEELLINNKFDSIDITKIEDNYKEIYGIATTYDTYNKRINFIFAYTHQKLNYYLEKFNKCINKTKHYSANDSRELIKIIKFIYELKEGTNNSKYEFILNNEYSEYLKAIENFLKETNGSDILNNIEEIKLIKYEKIFDLKSNVLFINPVNDTKEILKIVSNRNADFESMSIDEKLENINISIENILKDGNNKFKNIDYNNLFQDFISEEDVKKYRKSTHCFRHGSDESLKERRVFSENQKIFLINYGLIILNTINNEK